MKKESCSVCKLRCQVSALPENTFISQCAYVATSTLNVITDSILCTQVASLISRSDAHRTHLHRIRQRDPFLETLIHIILVAPPTVPALIRPLPTSAPPLPLIPPLGGGDGGGGGRGGGDPGFSREGCTRACQCLIRPQLYMSEVRGGRGRRGGAIDTV
jgi:hypothetical protein